MLTLKTTSQFRKDYKTARKRGYNLSLLEAVLDTLLEQKPLPEKHHDHALIGNYVGFRECHIQPDWLLIYRVDKDQLLLIASRMGTHADLFKK
jgi:mRNA interferase YafQ